MAPAPQAIHTQPALIDDRTTAVEALLRKILDHLAHATPDDMPGPETDHAGAAKVVLDIEVDGVSYRLVRAEATDTPPRAMLSPREREIVRLVAQGLPSKAIADVLDMSLWTVGTHLRRIFAKLGVGTRAEMIARVFEEDLLDSPAAAESRR